MVSGIGFGDTRHGSHARGEEGRGRRGVTSRRESRADVCDVQRNRDGAMNRPGFALIARDLPGWTDGPEKPARRP